MTSSAVLNVGRRIWACSEPGPSRALQRRAPGSVSNPNGAPRPTAVRGGLAPAPQGPALCHPIVLGRGDRRPETSPSRDVLANAPHVRPSVHHDPRGRPPVRCGLFHFARSFSQLGNRQLGRIAAKDYNLGPRRATCLGPAHFPRCGGGFFNPVFRRGEPRNLSQSQLVGSSNAGAI